MIPWGEGRKAGHDLGIDGPPKLPMAAGCSLGDKQGIRGIVAGIGRGKRVPPASISGDAATEEIFLQGKEEARGKDN